MGRWGFAFVFLLGMGIPFWTGCAGPSTPFGPVPLNNSSSWFGLDSAPAAYPNIRFKPERQVLHGAVPFSIIIEDSQKIPDNFNLKISYNGIDVTRKFLAKAEKKIEQRGRRVTLTIDRLRLTPSMKNDVRVTYRRAQAEAQTTADYQAPRCSPFDNTGKLTRISDFAVGQEVIDLIDSHSRKNHFNPYLLAGLIAQESGFNPHAVSSARALGLTQVTSQGEGEIVKKFSQWPRYPGIDQISSLKIKFMVMKGQLHSGNEWRFNPELSIAGGVEYLSYLSEYWSRPEKRALLEQKLDRGPASLGEVMLASYNSGAARVSAAIENKGNDWLQDSELNEARKYVPRVSSYCDYFSQKAVTQ